MSLIIGNYDHHVYTLLFVSFCCTIRGEDSSSPCFSTGLIQSMTLIDLTLSALICSD